jgi:hypothetical protein
MKEEFATAAIIQYEIQFALGLKRVVQTDDERVASEGQDRTLRLGVVDLGAKCSKDVMFKIQDVMFKMFKMLCERC